MMNFAMQLKARTLSYPELPRVKYRKHVCHVKPFWNSTLKDLRKAVMAVRLEWIRKGSQGSQRILITCNTKKLNANIEENLSPPQRL